MGSKHKGGKFERETCVKLSLWWSDGNRDDLFWRTASSGGRATQRSKRGKQTVGHSGDICATDKSAQPFIDCFVVELKRGYNRISTIDLIDRPNRAKIQQWNSWVEQARRECEESGSLFWLLIHKRDGRQPMIYFPNNLFPRINIATHLCLDVPIPNTSIKFPVPKGITTVQGCLFDSFLSVLRPKHIIELKKRYRD